MAASRIEPIIQHLRRLVLREDKAGMTDGQLLEDFISHRDAAAFEALVQRHGPMVLGVCRRILGNPHDAEDCFQATFLVLARKAASVSPREHVGNWMYGVARTTAVRAKAANAKRGRRERQVSDMPEPDAARQDLWDDVQPLLDEELARLPDKYRQPVVLCDLEGRPRREVAGQLRIPEGTLSSRLTTARRMLAKRLARRGLAVTVGSLTAMLAHNAVPACVPISLVSSTVKAAVLIEAGNAAAGVLSVKVAVLAEGVVKTMFVNKILKSSALVLLASGLALGVGGLGAGLRNDWTLAAAQSEGETKADEKQDRTSSAATTPKMEKKGERTSSGTMPKTEEKLREVKLGQVCSPKDYNTIFDNVLDVVDDYFEIAYANRYEGRIETHPVFERPHKSPRSEAERPTTTKQPVRWRAVAQIAVKDEGGYGVSIWVAREVETGTAKKDEKTPPPPASPAEIEEKKLSPHPEMNWTPIDRDTELEQVILRRLVEQERKRRLEQPRERKERKERAEREMPGRGHPNSILLRDVHVDVVDPNRTISVTSLSGRATKIWNVPVAIDAKIKVKGGNAFRDLKVGMRLVLELRVENNQMVVTEIRQVGIPPE
jgi:RNA polymerase sigma factor (sigma-70 family)